MALIKVMARLKGTVNGAVTNPRQTIGVFGNRRYRDGDIFFINKKSQLGSWMQLVEEDKPAGPTKEEIEQMKRLDNFRADLNALPEIDLHRMAENLGVDLDVDIDSKRIVSDIIAKQFPSKE